MTKLLPATIALFYLVADANCMLWPNPRDVSYGTSVVKLSSFLTINSISSAPGDLTDAIQNTKTQLFTDNLAQIPALQPDSKSLGHAKTLNTLDLVLNKKPALSITEEIHKPFEERDESYLLNIPDDGSAAKLEANTTLGLYRGLTTFTQLFYALDGTVYTPTAPVAVNDEPAYVFRGLLLDTSRNFFPVSSIYRTLDAMSYVKINTFNWHITDSQSFPATFPGYEILSEKGAYSTTETYSLAEIESVIAYANARGIDVIPEIDSPGHTGAIAYAYPEYVACWMESPWTTYANEPPAGQIRFMNETVVDFMSGLFKSATSISPGSYFSTGGDELNTACYANDAPSQAALVETGRNFTEALSYFVNTMHDTLRAEGKTPLVWEEMVDQWNLPLKNDTIVMVWISSANTRSVADLGYRFVHAPSDYFYLDCGGGEWIADDVNPSWCDPFKSWQIAYSFNPKENLTESQFSQIMGGEQLLWTEQSGPENLEPIVWPRAAASAEVFWTGETGPDGQPRNSSEAITRLLDLRYRMVARGINAINLQPNWCYLNQNKCGLFN